MKPPSTAGMTRDWAEPVRSMVKLRAVIPDDAFTAEVLGTQRMGNGVVINAQGLILTIGYLITEASEVWVTTHRGEELAGHSLAYDQVTGFGLVLPLGRIDAPALQIGTSQDLGTHSEVCVISHRQFAKPMPARIAARREFAGAWEYLLESAIFTSPAHAQWSGAALLDADARLVGLGSLLVREIVDGVETDANMFVPIDLLKPILEDLVSRGRAARATRPWLGVYAIEVKRQVIVAGVVDGGPAQRADIREGDLIAGIATQSPLKLADFYRCLWSLGPAGTTVPLTIIRNGTELRLNVISADRGDLFKRPQLH